MKSKQFHVGDELEMGTLIFGNISYRVYCEIDGINFDLTLDSKNICSDWLSNRYEI